VDTSSNDFKVQIAEDYWNETKAFWAEVRAEWKKLLTESGILGVKTQSTSGKLYNRILNPANETREGKPDVEAATMRARDIIHASITQNVAELDSLAEVLDQKQEYER
jgi:hypothetical protein